MSGTIWLITEDENDYKELEAIRAKKQINVKIKWRELSGGSGGVSRLRDQLESLIKTAIKEKSKQDCIAVLHDRDIHKQPARQIYDEIKRICEKYKVKQIPADDELESWLLSDAGLAKWLGIKHNKRDGEKEPSAKLRNLLHTKYNLKYQGRYRDEVLKHLDGNIISPSFREALKHLENAPCVKP
jgi:hypothetical protein